MKPRKVKGGGRRRRGKGAAGGRGGEGGGADGNDRKKSARNALIYKLNLDLTRTCSVFCWVLAVLCGGGAMVAAADDDQFVAVGWTLSAMGAAASLFFAVDFWRRARQMERWRPYIDDADIARGLRKMAPLLIFLNGLLAFSSAYLLVHVWDEGLPLFN